VHVGDNHAFADRNGLDATDLLVFTDRGNVAGQLFAAVPPSG
jgi:hypothetical protein